MQLLFRCKEGTAMNHFKAWNIIDERATGNGVTRVLINKLNEIIKIHTISGKDIAGNAWDMVFYCGRVENQGRLF